MRATPTSNDSPTESPFLLENVAAYADWRALKLSQVAASATALCVEIDNPLKLSEAERKGLLTHCERSNMSLYRLRVPGDMDKAALNALCAQLGLLRLDSNLCADEDGISSIQVEPNGGKQEYIPYSEMPMNWHTDGYYNTPENQIHGMVLHCVRNAMTGGGNGFVDPDLVYIALRDYNPNYIYALYQNDAMMIPANIQEGRVIRSPQVGPVFSIHPKSGRLHMRYTARTRSIEWKQDPDTLAAVALIEAFLATGLPPIYRYTLAPGEGIISNNVLHNRERFVNGDGPAQQRLIYRARFYDRVKVG